MTEKYNRNDEIPANQDFAKKTFFPKEDRIAVVFHFGNDKITASKREFRKPPLDQKNQILDIISNQIIGPDHPKMTSQSLYLQFLALLDSETTFVQEVKKYNQELKDILNLRHSEEKDLVLSISAYDTIRNKPGDDGEKDKKSIQEIQTDYLSPYLKDGEEILSKVEAIQVKEAALKSLKERLIEQVKIIQNRHDEATSALKKRQAEFLKLSNSTEDEKGKFCGLI